MFENLGWMEIICLVLIGLFIFGPERLPKVIGDAARFLRSARQMARNATSELQNELGTDIDITDLNPRTFVQKHLLSDEEVSDLSAPLRQAFGEVQSVTDLGEGQYELAVALRNVRADPSIYVMPPDMRGYVQIGRTWREIPLRPAADAPIGVSKIDGNQVYHYLFGSPGQRLHTTAAELHACAVF